MVTGMESFIQRFRDYSDCYTIIGGAACDILMTEADTDFRVTKDIDMNLLKSFGNISLKADIVLDGRTATRYIFTDLRIRTPDILS